MLSGKGLLRSPSNCNKRLGGVSVLGMAGGGPSHSLEWSCHLSPFCRGLSVAPGADVHILLLQVRKEAGVTLLLSREWQQPSPHCRKLGCELVCPLWPLGFSSALTWVLVASWSSPARPQQGAAPRGPQTARQCSLSAAPLARLPRPLWFFHGAPTTTQPLQAFSSRMPLTQPQPTGRGLYLPLCLAGCRPGGFSILGTWSIQLLPQRHARPWGWGEAAICPSTSTFPNPTHLLLSASDSVSKCLSPSRTLCRSSLGPFTGSLCPLLACSCSLSCRPLSLSRCLSPSFSVSDSITVSLSLCVSPLAHL